MWTISINEQNDTLISCEIKGGGFQILCIEGGRVPLFEISEVPQFGGDPIFDRGFGTLKEALAHSETYT